MKYDSGMKALYFKSILYVTSLQLFELLDVVLLTLNLSYMLHLYNIISSWGGNYENLNLSYMLHLYNVQVSNGSAKEL